MALVKFARYRPLRSGRCTRLLWLYDRGTIAAESLRITEYGCWLQLYVAIGAGHSARIDVFYLPSCRDHR